MDLQPPSLPQVIGQIPFRMALAGGWIDQPFVSRLNPAPPGSMVVVSLEPNMPFMERAGMATGTRKVATRIWNGRLPRRDPADLVRELYTAENAGRQDPSGSQDMIGLIYPGVSRLDYDIDHEGGIFPRHIESCLDHEVAGWIERVIHLIAIAPRPPGYTPLGRKNLRPATVARLGQTGKECFQAILNRDLSRLGSSMNNCMQCWEELLPDTVAHPTIELDLKGLLAAYQARYAGAMYSGCGGGYLLVAADEPVPGSFRVKVRTH
ncbi:MAG: hypothetical protein NZ561_04410 [Phycisphaerae bacterium]|nr:hypothetical protein [Phycisphaerae bacterium]